MSRALARPLAAAGGPRQRVCDARCGGPVPIAAATDCPANNCFSCAAALGRPCCCLCVRGLSGWPTAGKQALLPSL